jgi:hypothetical protein
MWGSATQAREYHEMKRAVLFLVALMAVACGHTPQEMEAYCARYAAKHMAYGTHENLNAYKEDLMSSCMAMHGVPYTSKAPASGGQASTR